MLKKFTRELCWEMGGTGGRKFCFNSAEDRIKVSREERWSTDTLHTWGQSATGIQ